MRSVCILLAVAGALCSAQSKSEQNGSISGVVKDAGTGAPLPGVTVSVFVTAPSSGAGTPSAREVSSTTNAQGRYELKDLPANLYRVWVRRPDSPRPFKGKMINLRAGQELRSVDFAIEELTTISGQITDQTESRRRVLLSSCYRGRIRSATQLSARKTRPPATISDNTRCAAAQPGLGYLVRAENREQYAAVSEAPDNPTVSCGSRLSCRHIIRALIRLMALRRSFCVRVNVAMALISVSAALCLCAPRGTLRSGASAIAGRFFLSRQDIENTPSKMGGLAGMPPGGMTSVDGKFRVCGLRPGAYRILAYVGGAGNSGSLFGTLPFVIADRDAAGLEVYAGSGVTIPGRVVWDRASSDPQPPADVIIDLRPVNRIMFQEEVHAGGQYSVPSEFSIPDAFIDVYEVQAYVKGDGLYIKDIIYGGASILNKAFQRQRSRQ